ncbi:MAG: hypothetical protein DCF12_01900 [Snowella sp.]|jgi:hypothetical protein|nr:MAG: hypothetical protein DCF12_01900 [Snowella sp.]
MKNDDKMTYRDWQKRNTNKFSYLNNFQKKEIRNRGYKNIGWIQVKSSWEILCEYFSNQEENQDNSISMFDYKISQGDIIGAINLSILESDVAKKVAIEAQKKLLQSQKYLEKISLDSLEKYPLL